MRITWSDHVLGRMQVRELDPAWIERTVMSPEVMESDPDHPGRVRVFAPVPERDDRVLRVVYEPIGDGDEIVIVTALLDRGRTRKRRQTSEV